MKLRHARTGGEEAAQAVGLFSAMMARLGSLSGLSEASGPARRFEGELPGSWSEGN